MCLIDLGLRCIYVGLMDFVVYIMVVSQKHIEIGAKMFL